MKTLTPNGPKTIDERLFYWMNEQALENLAEEIAEANLRHAVLRNALFAPPVVAAIKLPAASIEKLRESNKLFLEKRRQQAILRKSKPVKGTPRNRATLILIVAIGLVSTLATIATTVRF